jgi:hypothetical protein
MRRGRQQRRVRGSGERDRGRFRRSYMGPPAPPPHALERDARELAHEALLRPAFFLERDSACMYWRY